MIKAENLTKRFEEKVALDSINMEIPEGSIYGLIGSNGSGKSTLLRLISGVYMPDGGKITIDGEEVFDNPPVKAEVVFLGDTPYFLPQSNITEMADFYNSLYPSFDMNIYNRLISEFPLDPKARIASMSKGMQRQAALILAMSTSPQYLLLDEAFDGLDPVMRRVLKGLLINGAENTGMTTVISSHNLRELEDLCDRVGLIHSGNIIFNDEIDNLKGRIHKVQMAFEKTPELTVFDELDILKIERTGSLLQAVVRGNADDIMDYVNKFSPLFAECIEPTLEEIFLYELEVVGYDVKSIIN